MTQIFDPIGILAQWDDHIDLTVPHVVCSLTCSFLVFWLMMCRTSHASLKSSVGWQGAIRRTSLALLCLALFVDAWTPVVNDTAPWAAGVACRFALLLTLLSRTMNSAESVRHIQRAGRPPPQTQIAT